MSVSYGGDSITFADNSTVTSGWTGFKNKIINGAMQVAQRNTTATGITTTGYYACDRMAYYKGSSSGVIVSISQAADGPTGFTTCNKVQTTTANTTIYSTEYVGNMYYTVENKDMQDLDWGAASAKPLTLSFWVKSNKTGTYSISPYVNVSGSYYVINRTYTINQADTWEQKIISIPGFTTGSIPNNNDGAFVIYWNVRCGTGYTSGGVANDWTAYTTTNWAVGHTVQWGTSTSDYISVTGVQLEKGSTASSFEYRPYGTELSLCQRYYDKCSLRAVNVIDSTSLTRFSLHNPFLVEKRTDPTTVVTLLKQYNGSTLTVSTNPFFKADGSYNGYGTASTSLSQSVMQTASATFTAEL